MNQTVSVIGAGRIGGAVIRHVEETPGLRLGRVLTRSGTPDTADPAAFLATPADIIIDTAVIVFDFDIAARTRAAAGGTGTRIVAIAATAASSAASLASAIEQVGCGE